MIHLLIDAGNSSLKWRWMASGDTDQLPLPGRLAWIAPDFAGALVLAWSNAALHIARGRARATGCAVVSQERRALVQSAWRQLGGADGDLVWLSAQGQFSQGALALRNAYREPAQLGADRWHAMLGARAGRPGQALVVVCAGTATTVDSIDADGRHLGGVIAPGIRLMQTSLARGTDQLTHAPGDYQAFPDATAAAIRTGVIDAQAGLVIERVRQTRAITGTSPGIVICGGHGPELALHLRGTCPPDQVHDDPDLIFEGLRLRLDGNTA